MFETGLERNAANHAPLTPLSFLTWTAAVYPDRTAVIYGPRRDSYATLRERVTRLASALVARGIGPGDCVAVMAPNTPVALEAHYGVPAAGAVLNALNVRLDADTIAYILQHGAAKAILVDPGFADVVREALAQMPPDAARPLVVDVDDPFVTDAAPIGTVTYEALLAEGDPSFAWRLPKDEWQAISLNYTSGTTGRPKGVVYHHRGAYLNAMGNAVTWPLPYHPVYLWTLPMFHCNGWCFPWTITAMAGTHVCLRRVAGETIYEAFAEHGVTHLCGAPIVMSMILNAGPAERRTFSQRIRMMTAASAPPAAVLEGMDALGIDITHVYGLTEVYGPAVVCAWKSEWDALPPAERAAKKARQGVSYIVQEGLAVLDPDTMAPVPADGATLGEVMMRGNITMKGYLKNPDATAEAFRGGWFHTGDLGVQHPDGYIELKDRSKDIIISGGENISSIEVEDVLYRHPAVLEAAVVARPDDTWGETPCAFITLRPESDATEAELIGFCRERLAHFKCPKTVVFTDLPKTSTGKVQKTVLRDQAKALAG